MSLILPSSSQITSLEGLCLREVYPLPRVYSTIAEVPYPAGIYLLPPVYREGTTQAHNTTQKSEMTASHSSGEASKISAATAPGTSKGSIDSSDILYRQEVLLKHLKKVREEVDALERTLRKDASQKASQPTQLPSAGGNKTSAPPTASSTSLSESLKRMSGDRQAMQDLLLPHAENLLTRLKHLRGKLDQFSTDSGQPGNKVEKKRKIIVNSPRTRSSEKTQELVVVADPKSPPLSLFSAANMLASKFAVATNTFVHSSVQKMPEHLREFLDDAASTDSLPNADFVLTLIWKEMKNSDTSLMVDASRQTVPIISEANIVRYILRLMNDKYDSPEHSKDYIANEKWLNVASRQVVYGNSKERQSAVRSLNGHLGKSAFLTNTSGPTLVDIALLSALLETQCSLVGNVKKWAVACCQSSLLENADINL
ncbi:hypothetical protein RvY_17940 [Ramazzottius varieornatus]|uniref:AIMP2 thioredoxin-like domain-containing protein n=1 Tax=Ramazzottius varieornatus TaxID=947166 RepID=A0A1D1W9K1_RAMVA|nr:hypothetical protein RvY_17940 [Ramazzottius varieornatus]